LGSAAPRTSPVFVAIFRFKTRLDTVCYDYATFCPDRVVAERDAQLGVDQGVAPVMNRAGHLPHFLQARSNSPTRFCIVLVFQHEKIGTNKQELLPQPTTPKIITIFSINTEIISLRTEVRV
jgi:hypothetical protein